MLFIVQVIRLKCVLERQKGAVLLLITDKEFQVSDQASKSEAQGKTVTCKTK